MLNHSDNIRSNFGVITPDSTLNNIAIKTKQKKESSLLSYLKATKYKFVNWLVDTIIFQIIKYFERGKITMPGVYQCQHHHANGLDNLSLCSTSTDINIDTEKPVLLFIHGTISSSKHGFSSLWNPSNKHYMQELLRPYGQQVFFLEHYTISTSPVENTLAIAKLFPKDTRFHIVSHSRGGIIGELLCQSNLKRRTKTSGKQFVKTKEIFSERELAVFRQDRRRKADYAGLKQLQQIFLEKQFSVERFIRIAAPMRGTALSSESIDEVVTRVFNTLHAIPIPRILGIRSLLSSIAFTFIKKARSIELMPGIESMMPNSPLIALLNRDSVQLQDELSVIAGESTTTGIIPYFKHQWLTHNIFKEAHDYVINISAAFGGSPRPNGASRYYLNKNDDVGHFNYFQHEVILQRIQEALTAPLGTIGQFKLFSTEHFNPTIELNTATNSTQSNNDTIVTAKTINSSWISLILQSTRRYCYAVNQSKLKINGLVANIQNQLFYIPSTEGWQPYSTGRKAIQVLTHYLFKKLRLNNLQFLCYIGTSRSVTHTESRKYLLKM